MAWTIIKVSDEAEEDRYIIWSSYIDAPITFASTADEVIKAFVIDAKERAIQHAKGMIAQAKDTGTSSRGSHTMARFVCSNRAGPSETRLSLDEIMEFYVRRKKMPDKGSLARYRKRKKLKKP